MPKTIIFLIFAMSMGLLNISIEAKGPGLMAITREEAEILTVIINVSVLGVVGVVGGVAWALLEDCMRSVEGVGEFTNLRLRALIGGCIGGAYGLHEAMRIIAECREISKIRS